MSIPVTCRDCGQVAVEAADLHLHVLPPAFTPYGTYLCPGCGARGVLDIGPERLGDLTGAGALVIDAAVGCCEVGCLAPEDAAELRQLLGTDGWFDRLRGAEGGEP